MVHCLFIVIDNIIIVLKENLSIKKQPNDFEKYIISVQNTLKYKTSKNKVKPQIKNDKIT